LEPLTDEHIGTVIGRAVEAVGVELTDDALAALVQHAQGDARRALNTVEALQKHIATSHAPSPTPRDVVMQVLEKPLPIYDKSGEQHFNLISALHKAVRGSDAQGALYWLARMLAGGEDPLYLARRLVRIASEDVGLADPRALAVALAAKEYPAEPVPLHIRNAPTKLMKELGYGAGYKYGPEYEDGYAPQEYLPKVLEGARWYEPTEFGFEKDIKRRIEWWESLKKKAEP
ncbi:MAG TPA: recombination factor protein RarA, partial [Gemmatimonadales bacterium]|nr:recombination factor protein RarA [Gemmatimonadales bacterium]